eukprot:c10053_g1_i1.p1 GENE.c10053_g1_i1~~c10053_g1_i1.p1  ORF type:complete len:126 (-),score=32.96 c10053_g1_i1:747-1124(-)
MPYCTYSAVHPSLHTHLHLLHLYVKECVSAPFDLVDSSSTTNLPLLVTADISTQSPNLGRESDWPSFPTPVVRKFSVISSRTSSLVMAHISRIAQPVAISGTCILGLTVDGSLIAIVRSEVIDVH